MRGTPFLLWNVRINAWVIRTGVEIDIAVLDNVVVFAFILKLLLELLVLDYQVGDSRVERCNIARVLVYLLLVIFANSKSKSPVERAKSGLPSPSAPSKYFR